MAPRAKLGSKSTSMGPWGLSIGALWLQVGPKWSQQGSRRLRLWTTGAHDESKESKHHLVGGQKWAKRAPKRALKATKGQ